jgi:predicted nucleic acid-binding protein
VRNFLESQLRDPDVGLAITAQILHEFVHVITDARRFDPPVPMQEAIGLARLYLNRGNVFCLASDASCFARAFDLLVQLRLGRNRIADTLFAATVMANGITQVITFNGGDFEVFKSLTVIDPR